MSCGTVKSGSRAPPGRVRADAASPLVARAMLFFALLPAAAVAQQQECAQGIPGDTTPLCEWIGDCPSCPNSCVLNKRRIALAEETFGAAISRRSLQLNALKCTALSLYVRYGSSAANGTLSAACPSEQELAQISAIDFWPASLLPVLERYPDVSAELTSALREPGELRTFFLRSCASYTLQAPVATAVGEFWGVNFASGLPDGAFCGDNGGQFLQFYVAEKRCVSSSSQDPVLRACLGDEAKWLDPTCVLAYLDAAAGRTIFAEGLKEIGEDYLAALQTMYTSCSSRNESDCEVDVEVEPIASIVESFDTSIERKLRNRVGRTASFVEWEDNVRERPGEEIKEALVALNAAPSLRHAGVAAAGAALGVALLLVL